MPSRIRIGNRVSGAVGDFIDPPACEGDGRKRRRRERCHGVVLGLADKRGKWFVLWENEDEPKIECGNHLKDEGKSDISDEALQRLQIRHKIRRVSTTSSAPASAPASQQPAERPTSEREQRTPPNSAPGDEESDDDIDGDAIPYEDEHDREINALTMDADDAARHSAKVAAYEAEKDALIGKKVKVGQGSQMIEWTVRKDVDFDEVDPGSRPNVEYRRVGVQGFDFSKLDAGTTGDRKRLNLLRLLIHLWPGDWRLQLQRINQKIKEYNEQLKKKRNRNGNRVHLVKTMSEREFWYFWGLILAARVHGRKGELWDRKDPEGIRQRVDYSHILKEYRFDELKKFVPFMWARPELQDSDPWWQYSLAVKEFNENRSKKLLTSRKLVPDELMSALRPRTTKTGNLPNLSHISRKPEDMGTEYKVVACGKTTMLRFLEIQRGKQPMREAQYASQFGVQAACTMRLAQNARRLPGIFFGARPVEQIFYADSWFTCVKAAIQLRSMLQVHMAGVVKKSHARYPLKFLEETMKDWPSGSHLVLEGHPQDDFVSLIAVGHKYSSKKVICFLFTKGAGRTVTSCIYEATWKDANLNTRSRRIPRPEIMFDYFDKCNIVDMHNQARQFELRLEKQWVTEDGFFRNETTMFGVNVTDGWKAYRFHINQSHRHKFIEIEDFASILAEDCFSNDFSPIREEDIVINIDVEMQESAGGAATSKISQEVLQLKVAAEHIAKRTTRQEKNTKKSGVSGLRAKRSKCRVCHAKTPHFCAACGEDYWICCPDTGRNCLETHRAEVFQGKRDGTD